MLVSVVNDVKSFTVLDPSINFSDHLPLRVDLLIRNNENTLQDIENKNPVDKSTSYTMPQLRWDKADQASYYFYTGQQLQPVLSYVEYISKASETGYVSADCMRYYIESTYCTVVSILCMVLELMLLNVTRFFRLDALAKALMRNSYSDVAGWLGGWLAGCHTPVLYQNR